MSVYVLGKKDRLIPLRIGCDQFLNAGDYGMTAGNKCVRCGIQEILLHI